jgi:hypothetical protein
MFGQLDELVPLLFLRVVHQRHEIVMEGSRVDAIAFSDKADRACLQIDVVQRHSGFGNAAALSHCDEPTHRLNLPVAASDRQRLEMSGQILPRRRSVQRFESNDFLRGVGFVVVERRANHERALGVRFMHRAAAVAQGFLSEPLRISARFRALRPRVAV